MYFALELTTDIHYRATHIRTHARTHTHAHTHTHTHTQREINTQNCTINLVDYAPDDCSNPEGMNENGMPTVCVHEHVIIEI